MKKLLAHSWHLTALFLLFAVALVGCGSQSSSNNGPVTLNLGYFPNLTHAVALVGVERGTFKSALGSNVKLETKTFNAGPALIEALFAGDIDIGYVGPNPAINGYVKSHGQALRIIAGAASGGALFVVRSDEHIQSPGDLANKKFASPQLGGTQDVALRYYLQQHGLKTVDKGGNVQILPTDNPNILTLFKQGKIDGAWVPEPWATRLVVEGKGKIFVDERTLWPTGRFVTTTVAYIQANPESAKSIVNGEIKRITGKALLSKELDQAYTNLDITYDPLTSTMLQSADRAYSLGFLGSSQPNLNGIYYLGPLNQVLTSKGLAHVTGP